MVSNVMRELYLPSETAAVAWRIFGAGASPSTGRSSYELIKPVVRKHVSSADQNETIMAILGWFESQADQRHLKPDLREPVAALILQGIRTERSETAIWAAGSVDTNLAESTIQSDWSPDEIDSFVEAALATLAKLCKRDDVLDATGVFPDVDATSARIPKSGVVRTGRLETLRHLDGNGFELVCMGLRPEASRLIELVVALRPEAFVSLIARVDHPVMHARAAHHVLGACLPVDHRTTLRWISRDSCDDLVALAIFHTLKTVSRLDEDRRSAERADADRYGWSTELRPPRDDLDAAATGLLNGLVDRLAVLEPLACARWTGELLSGAGYVLHGGGVNERGTPPRIDQLEKACTALLARLARESWSDDLLAALRAGLCLTPRDTWPRHLAEVAWAIRGTVPARAVEIARATLDEHQRHLAEELQRNHLFLNWNDWHDREWISGLGVALALSQEDLDLPTWVSSQCRGLPLTVWDAEETYSAFGAADLRAVGRRGRRGPDFSTADRAARHWFLIGFHALPALKQLGRTIDPSTVRTLAETLWSHCRFSGRHLHADPEASVEVEYAARSVVEFGEPNDTWLLDQARHPGIGPRAMWALNDQRRLKRIREGRTDGHHAEIITAEFIRIASDRFSDGGQYDLEALRFWGRLWLLLGAVDEAERTATAIITFPRRTRDRADDILTLKLLALTSRMRKPAPVMQDYIASCYRGLWPGGYTPDEERTDRQEIDELLEASASGTL